MQYLIRILDPSATPATNQQFVAILSAHAGEKFKASVTWSAYCNPNKTARFANAEGVAEEVESTTGCGENFYQQSIPTDDDTGQFESQFSCSGCGAVVRSFPKLRNYRSVN